jgi:predicted alpha/beta hydrolase
LQHALMDSSAGWLLLGPKRALALQLADAGFDVWLGNSRGNRYSRNHTRLNPDDHSEFWGYSWDDLAQHDLPASIRYSMAVSQQFSLVYIGYSQVRPAMTCSSAAAQEYG